jgi:hypothetical protein
MHKNWISKIVSLTSVFVLLVPIFQLEHSRSIVVDISKTASNQPVATGSTSKGISTMFIENVGQFPNEAHFQMRGTNSVIWLADNAVWITIFEPENDLAETMGHSAMSHHESPAPVSRMGVNLKLTFIGASSKVRLEPYNRKETTVSYFLGNDVEKWQTDVPVWGGVRYEGLYPGVNMHITSEGDHWVWRLVCIEVKCPSAFQGIRLRVEGADAVTLDSNHLDIITAVHTIRLPLLAVEGIPPGGQPTAYALEPGVFDVAFPIILSSQSDSIPLMENPADLLYSTFLGGDVADNGSSIVVDGSGAAFITGRTDSSNFPITPGAFDTTHNGYGDAFVAKVSPDGSSLVYATFLGGEFTDVGVSIAVDGTGAAFITGNTNSTNNFPTTEGAFDTTYNGSTDAFVTKVAPDGDTLIFSTFLGGSVWDEGYGIALGGSGAVYVYGNTSSANFPTTQGAFDITHNGSYDAFLTKMTYDGSALAYSTYLGGSSNETGGSMIVDGSGAAYVTGITSSSNFPIIPGSFDTTHNGNLDAFVSKVSTNGNALLYSTFLGGGADDQPTGIVVDTSGATYVAGATDSTGFPTTPEAFDTTHNGVRDAFVSKLGSDGGTLDYSTFLRGSSSDSGSGIAVDGNEVAYITGVTGSSNFPTTVDAYDTTHNGANDVFAGKITADGSSLAYSTFLGGSGDDSGRYLTVDDSWMVYVTGKTGSSNFPTTPGAFDTTFSGLICGTPPNTYPCPEVFVAKLAMGNTITPPTIIMYLPLVVRD